MNLWFKRQFALVSNSSPLSYKLTQVYSFRSQPVVYCTIAPDIVGLLDSTLLYINTLIIFDGLGVPHFSLNDLPAVREDGYLDAYEFGQSDKK